MNTNLKPLANNEILALTSLRFLAAFYVFIFHCHIHYGAILDLKIVNAIIKKGHIGMTFFFVLSGYIMAYVYKNFNETDIKKYYVNRLARIYPTYLAYGLLGLPFFVMNHETLPSIFSGQNHDDLLKYAQLILSVIAFLLMIQAWFPPLFKIWNFGGSWAISVEAFLYLVFPFIRKIANKASLNFLYALIIISYLWTSMPIIYACMFAPDKAYFYVMNINIYISPIFRIGEFMFGLLIYILSEERNVLFFKNRFVLIALSLLLLGFVALKQSWPGFSFLSFIAVPSFAWTISWLKNKRVPLLETKFLVYLGHISYSFYLAQFIMFAMVKEQIKEADISMTSKWSIAFIVTLFVSIILYHLVEKPFRTHIRRRFS
jgi:peptidoglycan/LPS O-acetylase OafA/YrhL